MLFQVQNSILKITHTYRPPSLNHPDHLSEFKVSFFSSDKQQLRKVLKEHGGHKYCFSIMMTILCSCKQDEPFLFVIVDYLVVVFADALKEGCRFSLQKHSCVNRGSLEDLPKRWKTLNRRYSYCYRKGSIIF